jgi:hypothetical protein
MPARAPEGYHVALSDDFWHLGLQTSKWYRWAGEPGGDPYGWWQTPTDVAAYGVLSLRATRVSSGGNPSWTAGGVVTSGVGSRHAQTYGIYEWCMRQTSMPGTTTDVLLWPKAHRWPPEIDLYESDGSSTSYSLTLHSGTASNDQVIQRQVNGYDATQWHVYKAIWQSGLVELYEDGALVASLSSPKVPSIQMRFDVQSQAMTPDASVGTMTLGWVVEYERTR